MAHVIVGIHGLSNKPDPETLNGGWLQSIMEGLNKNCGIQSQTFKFDFVYWADTVNDNPTDNTDEPYLPSTDDPISWGDRGLDDRVRQYAVRKLSNLLLIFPAGRWVRGKFFERQELKDLRDYYDENYQSKVPLGDVTIFRKVITGRLRNVLLKHAGDHVMVIAHSMGAIVAYDVLRDLGQDSEMEVEDLATIGAPLGYKLVRDNVERERSGPAGLRTPTILVQRWGNYSDAGDRVALNWDLSKFYGANKRAVRVVDMIVRNTYVGTTGKQNKHKSYGYLRTPELSGHIRNFLSRC